MKLALIGPEGSFSQTVALTHFKGKELSLVGSIDTIFDQFEEGLISSAIVPLYQPRGGFVDETVDGLIDFSGVVVGEAYVPLTYNLVGHTKLERSQSLLVDPFAYKHCKATISKLCPHCQIVLTETDVDASQLISGEAVAITTPLAAQLYNIPVIASSIEDHPDEYIRFLILGHQEPLKAEKTSLILLSLKTAVEPKDIAALFQKNAVDLYNFAPCNDSMHWIDCSELHPSFVEELEGYAEFKIVGSYPNDSPLY